MTPKLFAVSFGLTIVFTGYFLVSLLLHIGTEYAGVLIFLDVLVLALCSINFGVQIAFAFDAANRRTGPGEPS